MLRNDRGLTLLEMIISIVLIATIILVVSGAMRLGYRSIDSGDRKIDFLERLRSSLTIIRAQIQSVVPLTSSEGGSKRFYFEGSSDSMRIATNYSIWGGRKGCVMVEYRIETDDKGMQGLVAVENIVGAGKRNEARLLQGFNAIFFEYFFQDPTKQEGTWVDKWTNSTVMPQKVRLCLVQGRKEIFLIIPMWVKGSLAGIDPGRMFSEGLQVDGYAA